ncbi:MAG TPA: peptide-methionine (S)-S-oxide reductase MsrA [Bryobacteraceae bacterium]|nr:peptide-methionine (S)-S-oxide reductase MsrA [Bryobacteraceae bacterium]
MPALVFPDPATDETLSPGAAKTAVLAGGCFWCTEAVFQQLDGVEKVVSGYSGGQASTANYDAVCSGRTGHAEAIQITYDPSKVSYGRLLKIFFSVAHDPTQLNRQGNDVGTQYRSAIFYSDPEQQRIAEAYIQQLDQAKIFRSPIATVVSPLEAFYPAEGYHQNYCNLNPQNPYVAAVAMPKVDKTRKQYSDLLKEPVKK